MFPLTKKRALKKNFFSCTQVSDTGHTDSVIGQAVIRISDIIKQVNMEYPNQPFHLKGGRGT